MVKYSLHPIPDSLKLSCFAMSSQNILVEANNSCFNWQEYFQENVENSSIICHECGISFENRSQLANHLRKSSIIKLKNTQDYKIGIFLSASLCIWNLPSFGVSIYFISNLPSESSSVFIPQLTPAQKYFCLSFSMKCENVCYICKAVLATR